MDKGIEYILEVARCGGITKAAENLFITPSALSKFVQAREAELQVKLFHRGGISGDPDPDARAHRGGASPDGKGAPVGRAAGRDR